MHGLFAVHILDGALQWPWLVGGFVGAGLLTWLATWRLREEEIPRVAVMSSAFFVATLIHVPLPPTSAHLLLNGLVGVILGRRTALAIVPGLLLQALLLGHGGLSTLGLNACIMILPALGAWGVFELVRQMGWLSATWSRWLVGFLLGAVGVLATATLNAAVLWLGGLESWGTLAMAVLVAHLPLAGVEGLVMASTVSFLTRVKPAMLRMQLPPRAALSAVEKKEERQAG
jgi:cobalt/nickel transport system permease protein